MNATWTGAADETALGAAAHMGRRDIAPSCSRAAPASTSSRRRCSATSSVRAALRRTRQRGRPRPHGIPSSSTRGGRRARPRGARLRAGSRESTGRRSISRRRSRRGRAPVRLGAQDIPQDLRDALYAAGRETSVTGQRVLQTILKNVNVAEDEKNLVYDTGSRSTTAVSASTSRSTRRASTPRSRRAPSARRSSTRCARTPCTR